MKTQIVILILLIGIFFSFCKKETEVIDSLSETAALRKVTVDLDSMSNDIGLPSGALTQGLSFAELLAADSATYANPANYSIAMILNLLIDNTKDGAKDAAFSGLDLNIIMDTINSTPINTSTGAFEVAENATLSLPVPTEINLATHRQVGLYMFRQIVDGADLATTITPLLKYNLGIQSGDIPLVSFQKDIPTRASDETKEFLAGLLDSGIMNITE